MSLSLEPDEGERYLEILRRARQRDPEANKTEIIRALFRFPDSNAKLLTKEDRDYFFQRIPVITQTADTQVIDINRPKKAKPVPCIWCGKPSQSGVCEDHQKALTSEPEQSRETLDELPYGAIMLNEDATIIGYNKAEFEMSRVSHKTAFGKNFFIEVAPCADVQDFYGRYDDFLRGNKTTVDFNFTYPFKRSPVNVLITFRRVDERRVLVTAQKVQEMPKRGTGKGDAGEDNQ